MRGMDLTKEYPRSPKDQMNGIYSLPRVIDKAHAHNEGTLGEYDYDCPHDKPVLEFLGVSGEQFANKVRDLKYDDNAISGWTKELMAKKTPQDVEAYNKGRISWRPDNERSQTYYNGLREQVAPGRKDINTWFDVLDLDEKRPVNNPTL